MIPRVPQTQLSHKSTDIKRIETAPKLLRNAPIFSLDTTHVQYMILPLMTTYINPPDACNNSWKGKQYASPGLAQKPTGRNCIDRASDRISPYSDFRICSIKPGMATTS